MNTSRSQSNDFIGLNSFEYSLGKRIDCYSVKLVLGVCESTLAAEITGRWQLSLSARTNSMLTIVSQGKILKAKCNCRAKCNWNLFPQKIWTWDVLPVSTSWTTCTVIALRQIEECLSWETDCSWEDQDNCGFSGPSASFLISYFNLSTLRKHQKQQMFCASTLLLPKAVIWAPTHSSFVHRCIAELC